MIKSNLFIAVFVFVLITANTTVGQNVWYLGFQEPQGAYVHKTTLVGCFGHAHLALEGNQWDPNEPHPPGQIPAVAVYSIDVVTPDGSVSTEMIAGSGTLTVQGEANPGRFSGVVSPNTEWQIGTQYSVRAVDKLAYTGSGSFSCVASNQDGLDAFLVFLKWLLG